MTQALVNNLNNLNNALVNDTSTVTNPIGSVARPAEFAKMLDAKLDDNKTTPSTIGDIKADVSESDIDIMADFRKIVSDATNEASAEDSLDLTLARDIKDIIQQLKASLKLDVEITDTEEDTEQKTDVAEVLVAESDKDTTDSADKNNNEPAFEKLLAAVEVVIPEIQPLAEVINEQVVEKVNETTSKLLNNFDENIIEQETVELTEKTLPEGIENELENVGESIENSLDKDMLKELNVVSVKADTDTEHGGEFTHQQSAEEYAVKAMIHNTTETVNINFDNIQTQIIQPKAVEISPDKVIEQIVKHMENLHNNSKVNIVLNPESLGKVNLQIINTKEGMSAQFTVTTQEARDLIMKGIDGLKENLLAHGVNVDNISVKVSETEKESYNQDWTEQEGSRGGNKDQSQQNREEKEKGLFEKTLAKTFEENGNV